MTLVTVAVYLKSPGNIKLLFVLASISWGFYGYFIGYYELIIFEILITSAGLMNVLRQRPIPQ